MATITIMNTRTVRRNVAIASFLNKMRHARSKSLAAAMDRQPDLRTSSLKTTYHPCPGERYNWPAQRGLVSLDRDNWHQKCGASTLASDQPTFALQLRVRHNWPAQREAGQSGDRHNFRSERGVAANGAHSGLMGGRHDWPAQRGLANPDVITTVDKLGLGPLRVEITLISCKTSQVSP